MPGPTAKTDLLHGNRAAPLSLAIELAGRSGEVAIGRNDDLLAVEPVDTGARDRDDLMPAIDRLLRRVGIASWPRDIREVYVSIGPGGFTGLRVAVTTAKMLGFALPARLAAVPETWAVMQAAMDVGQVGAKSASAATPPAVTPNHAAVLLAEKRGRWWTEIFETDASTREWKAVGAPTLRTLDEIRAAPQVGAWISDRATDEMRQAVPTASMPVFEARSTAAACWRVGRRLARDGRFVEPLNLAPLYGREPEAVRLWNSHPHSRVTST